MSLNSNERFLLYMERCVYLTDLCVKTENIVYILITDFAAKLTDDFVIITKDIVSVIDFSNPKTKCVLVFSEDGL